MFWIQEHAMHQVEIILEIQWVVAVSEVRAAWDVASSFPWSSNNLLIRRMSESMRYNATQSSASTLLPHIGMNTSEASEDI